MSEAGSGEKSTAPPSIVAIDGPAGSGKSAVARRVAQMLGYSYLDTGAMYRAVGLAALRRGVSLENEEQLAKLAEAVKIELREEPGAPRVLLDGEDVSECIRTAGVAQAASKVAALAGVRRPMVTAQRRMASAGRVVLEGRDTGSHVFPGAGLKIFLTASMEERARRRMKDHEASGKTVTPEKLIDEMRDRDRRDSAREVSPLMRAADAVLVDNTAMDAEETARLIVMLAREQEQPSSESSREQAAIPQE
jgi:cytidylate kinase